MTPGATWTLVRDVLTVRSTTSRFYVDAAPFGFALEDPVRPPGIKISGATAIDHGVYRVVLDYSPRFGRLMPHVLDVPRFEGIRLHWGNFAVDTDGCPVLGKHRGPDEVWEDPHPEGTHPTFDALVTILKGLPPAAGAILTIVETAPSVLMP